MVLRDVGAVRRVSLPDGDGWLVTRHADVLAALGDPRLSASERHAAGADYRGFGLPPAFRHTMINADPDRHERLRRLVTPLMGDRAARLWRPRFRALADSQLAALDSDVDLVTDYAGPYVVSCLASWLGVPDGPLRAWAATVLRGRRGEKVRARDTLPTMVRFVTAELASASTQDSTVVGRLAHYRQSGAMSPDEATSMLFYLTFVWYEVCVNAVAAGLSVPGDRPVEEVLRWASPQVTAYRRFATVDIRWGDTVIEAGQTVFLSLLAANHDPAVFAEPSVFRPGRAPNPHLAFGSGTHRCVGRALARCLISEALHAYGPRPVSDGCPWTGGFRTHGPETLPARLDRGAASIPSVAHPSGGAS